jgi:hypothetical protein
MGTSEIKQGKMAYEMFKFRYLIRQHVSHSKSNVGPQIPLYPFFSEAVNRTPNFCIDKNKKVYQIFLDVFRIFFETLAELLMFMFNI